MVSGYDKTPPEDRYEPQFGPGARIIIIGFLAVLAFVSVGWLLI